MKQDFGDVLWTDVCGVTLQMAERGARFWKVGRRSIACEDNKEVAVLCFGPGFANIIVGPFKVPQSVKINSVNYCFFLSENFLPWYEQQ